MEKSTRQVYSRFEYAVRISEEHIDITVLLSFFGHIHHVRAKDAESRIGRQSRLGRRSKFDKAKKIGRIDRVTRARKEDKVRIVKKRIVEAEVTEVSRTTDSGKESNGKHRAKRQNQKRLTRNMVRFLNAIYFSPKP